MMSKLRWQTGLRLLMGPLLVGWLLYSIGWSQVWESIQHANGSYFILAVLCYAATIVLRTLRWQTFLRAQGISATARQLLPLDLIGGFFNLILPSSVGGDVVKFYRLGQQIPAAAQPRMAGTLIADRVTGIMVLLWLGAAMTPFTLSGTSLAYTIPTLTAVGTIALLLLLTERGRALLLHIPGVGLLLKQRVVQSLYGSLAEYTPAVLARAFGIALLFNIAMIGCYAALGAAFHLPVGESVYFVVVPLLSLAQALPFTLNGIGVREAGAVALLGLFGVSQGGALALALGYTACLVLAGLAGATLTLGESLRPLWTLTSQSVPHSDGGSSTL